MTIEWRTDQRQYPDDTLAWVTAPDGVRIGKWGDAPFGYGTSSPPGWMDLQGSPLKVIAYSLLTRPEPYVPPVHHDR